MTAPNVAPATDPMAELDATIEEAVGALAPGVDTPASPAAPPAPAPATPAEAGPPRDDKGRFTAPTPAAAASPAPEAAPATPPETPPETPAEAPAEPESFPPFEYTANGRPFTIEGSQVGEDGVFIPTAQVPYLTRTLAEAHQNRDFGRELGRVKADATREGQALKDEFFGKLRQLKAIATDPEKLGAWGEDVERNWALLEAQAKLDLREKELTQLQQREQEQARETARREVIPKCQQVLRDQVARFVAEPAVAGLFAAADQQALVSRLGTFFDRIFEEDANGEVMVDVDLIRRELAHEAEWRRRLQGAAAQRQQIAAQNAATASPSPAPPTVGARTTTATSTPAAKTYKSAAEADAAIWDEDFSTL